jgi:ABC-type glycerol-3-phosphate transport system permease component
MLTRNIFTSSLINSLFVTFASLVLALAIGLSCSYILARTRYRLGYKGSLMFWVLLVRILPPIAFALPLYIMMTRLGLLGTYFPLIFAHILINLPFIIWFMISFFESLSIEVEESAKLDGATELQLFIHIVLPLVMPGITAGAILSFMTSWNEYLYGAIFVQSPSRFTIPLMLATLNSEQELAQWGNIAAGGVISMIPIILFVVFAQNFLIKGLSSGAVKE